MKSGPDDLRSAPPPPGGAGSLALTRREALRLLAAQMTLSVAACGMPDEEIVPYVRMPEPVVPGQPLAFATVLPMSGYGRGVVVSSVDGRPVKIEGNPDTRRASAPRTYSPRASILSLYDPDRSRTVLRSGAIASWDMFLQDLVPQLQRLQSGAGEGLRILTGRITSPTLSSQCKDLLKRYPKAVWHAYEPALEDPGRDGATLAYGRRLSGLPHLDRAEVIVSLGADPLGPGPDQIRNGRAYATGRAPRRGPVARLYAIDAVPTLTAAKADHRIGLSPAQMGEAAVALANALGAGLRPADLPDAATRFIEAAAQDLQQKRGRALVLAGQALTTEAHAVVHWINAKLDAPVDLIEPVDLLDSRETASLAELARDLDTGEVRMLVILDSNPVYDAPADLDFAGKMKKAPFRVHAGPYANETADHSMWHLPLSHPLESWSDLRSVDGTAAIMQPLIRPLYATRTIHEIVAMIAGQPDAASYDLVRRTWLPQGGDRFEQWWVEVLHAGVVPATTAKPVPVGTPELPQVGAASKNPAELMVMLRPDPCVWDGSFANNAWLQELPKPLTKQVWGNALGLGPADAARLDLTSGDIVRLTAGPGSIEVPVSVDPGHAAGVASLTLGYGRSRAGAIGTGVGSNAYLLRTSEEPWVLAVSTIEKTGKREDILKPQNIVQAPDDVDREAARQALPGSFGFGSRRGRQARSRLRPCREPLSGAAAAARRARLGDGDRYLRLHRLQRLRGRLPGREQRAGGRPGGGRARPRHALAAGRRLRPRSADHPQPGFSAGALHALREGAVRAGLPGAASVHDGEGLNVQVYNRCIGTRFCEANCPYKVRRFNFFGYADGQEYANLGAESFRRSTIPTSRCARAASWRNAPIASSASAAARRAAEQGRPPDRATTKS